MVWLSRDESKIFARVCLWLAASGVLHLSDMECMCLYRELYIVSCWLDDKDVMMLVCNELGLLSKKLRRFNEAIQWQQLHVSLAIESKNKVYQVEAYDALAFAFVFAKKSNEAVSCFEQRKSIAREIGDKDSELDSCEKIGNIFFVLGHHDDAIKFYKQQLAVAIEMKNDEARKWAYGNMADAYESKQDFPEAITCYEEWLKIGLTNNEEQRSKVLYSLGAAYYSIRNCDKAIQCFKDSLYIATKQSKKELQLQLSINLGISFSSQNRFLEAIDYYLKVPEFAIALGDRTQEGMAYDKLGSLFEHTKDYDKAIDYYSKALTFAKATDDKEKQTTTLEHLGDVNQLKGDYEQAIKWHEEQLHMCLESGNKAGQVQAYSRLGYDYDSVGNYNQSITYYNKQLEVAVDKQGQAFAHIQLGIAYRLIGQFQEALAHGQNGLKLARESGTRKDLEVKANESLGDYYIYTSEHEKATQHFTEALEIVLKLDDEQGKAHAYGRLGICMTLTGKSNDALSLLDKQIHIAKSIGDETQESWGYRSKAFVHENLENLEEALHCYETSLTIDKATCNQRELSSTLHLLGRVHSRMACHNMLEGEQKKHEQHMEKAIQLFEESLTMFQLQFKEFQKQDHFKISFLEKMIVSYNSLTLILLTGEDYEKALLVSERGRARALTDLLTTKYDINSLDSQSLGDSLTCDDIKSMASDFSILFYSQIQQVHCTWVISQTNISSTIGQYSDDGFSKFLESAYEARNVQCEDRQIQTEERPTRSPRQFSFGDINNNSDDLLAACESIKKRCVPDEDLYDDDNPNPLEHLHTSLISPFLDQLTEDEIVIIPDGSLFKVPFAALRDPLTGKFLSERKRIRLAPSLTSMKLLRESPVDFHCKTGALIIGNPKVAEVKFQGQIKQITDLPGAQEEAEMIGRLLGVKPLIGSRATKEAIKERLREGVAIIHFAAHGTLEGEIFLTPSANADLPSEEDYILTMKDVQESGVRPQLVVLSCCHSGRGEIKAEGVVGMSRAFLAAGARAVVASLWAIADQATMMFMERFYTHLKDGKSASKSLQEAMNDMRGMPKYNDMQFWAPFFLIGDDVTIMI